MKKNKNVEKSIIYNSIGSGIYLFCQWLMTFIVVWISGYKTAGILSISMSITSTFSVIATLNMRNYQSSDLKGKYSEKTYLITRMFTCVLALVITLLYCLTKNFSNAQFWCVMIFMVFKLSEAIVDVIHGSIQKKWRFDIIGLSYAIRGLISISLFSLVLFLTKNLILSLMFMTIGVYIFIYFFDIRKYKKLISDYGKFKKIYLIQLLIHCIPLSLYGIVFNYVSMYPKVYAEKIFGESLIGYYASVATPALVIQVAVSFIFTPLTSMYADLYEKKDYKTMNKSVFKIIVLILCLTFIALIFSHFFADFILSLIFGSEILKYSYLFSGVVIISGLTALIWFLGMLLVVIRKNNVLFNGSLFSLLIVLMITPKMLNLYKLNGINITLIICFIIQSIIFLISFLRKDKKETVKESIYYIRSTSIINDSRATKEISSLIKNGFDVCVLGWDRTHIIKDYNEVEINGKDVDSLFFKFKCNYGESFKNVFGLILFQLWLFFRLMKDNKKYVCIHACDFDCGYVSYIISNMYEKKLVYDMYDYYSDSRTMSSKMERIVNKLENSIIDSADVSIICGEWRKNQIKNSNPKRLIVIHNSPEIKDIKEKKIIKNKSKKLKIVYVGILQDHRLLLEILEEMKKNNEYELHVGGFGKYEKEFENASNEYNNIYYYGSLKYNDVLNLEKDCDILFATYDPKIKNHKYSAPNKIYEAMALGKPIIVCYNTGIDQLIVSKNIGDAIDYDAKEFIKALKKYNKKENIKDVEKRAKKLYFDKYSWNSMEKILISEYKNLLGGCNNDNSNNPNI